jgi:hypothetical protein
MSKAVKNQEKIYRVVCGGMDSLYITFGENPQEAAAGALKDYIQLNKENAELSPILCVYSWHENLKEEDEDILAFYTPSVLEDIGFFALAKKLSEISDFLLDTDRNRY